MFFLKKKYNCKTFEMSLLYIIKKSIYDENLDLHVSWTLIVFTTL